MHGFDLAKSVVGLIGNVSSAVGAGFIIVCYLFVLPVNGHFRHGMILNLAVADFMNASIGTFNQAYLLSKDHTFPAGKACTAIGATVQLSVQAVDVSILAIAVVNYLAITRPAIFDSCSRLCVVAAIWVLPITTSVVGVANHYYRPASGGWCWIAAKPPHLRYALTHAWRLLFIAVILGIYTRLYFYLRRNFHVKDAVRDANPHFWMRKLRSWGRSESVVEDGQREELNDKESVPVRRQGTLKKFRDEIRKTHAREYELQLAKIKKAILLRAYPTWYVLLWIPGLANRMVEALGKGSPLWLILLQSSTSYIGLVNAITYGWNEGIARELRRKWELKTKNRSVGPFDHGGERIV